MGASVTMRRRSRAQHNAAWIEKFCVIASGPERGQPVSPTPAQKESIAQVYRGDDAVGGHVTVESPLSAYLALLHLCGPEAVWPWATPPHFEADIFTVWSSSGPDLRAVLQRRGELIVCPELQTVFPVADERASNLHVLTLRARCRAWTALERCAPC
jgi:hypothetical protein